MLGRRIFVTGASGKVGQFLTKELLNKEYELVLLSRGKINGFENKKVKFIFGDILYPKTYASGLSGVDTVLHLAAVTHTNKLGKYYEVNVRGTKGLIHVCKNNFVKRFIFLSSRTASEEGGAYSKSKLIAEKYVQESGIDWIILRLAEVYGISAKKGIDAVLKNIENWFFVPMAGSGEYNLAPVYIKDVVSAIINVIESPQLKNRIYTIAGPESFTYNELIDRIMTIKHIKKAKVYIPLFVLKILAGILVFFRRNNFLVKDQIPRLICKKSSDISLAVKELSFKPTRLEDILK